MGVKTQPDAAGTAMDSAGGREGNPDVPGEPTAKRHSSVVPGVQ